MKSSKTCHHGILVSDRESQSNTCIISINAYIIQKKELKFYNFILRLELEILHIN